MARLANLTKKVGPDIRGGIASDGTGAAGKSVSGIGYFGGRERCSTATIGNVEALEWANYSNHNEED